AGIAGSDFRYRYSVLSTELSANSNGLQPYSRPARSFGLSCWRLSTSTAQRPAGEGRRETFDWQAIRHNRSSVHQHMLDSARILVRVGVGGPVLNRRRVEDNQIRERTGLDRASVREPESCGRSAAELVHGVFERKQLPVAHTGAQQPCGR